MTSVCKAAANLARAVCCLCMPGLYQAAWSTLALLQHSSISRHHQRTPISPSSRPRLLDIVAAVTTAISFCIPTAAHPSIASTNRANTASTAPRPRGHERLLAVCGWHPASETFASVRIGYPTSRERRHSRCSSHTCIAPSIDTPASHEYSTGDLGSPTPRGG